MGAVLGVLGGHGGVGASSFAAVLAWVAGGVLVDLDPVGGGLDVLLGIETVPGARWSGVQVDGGRLDPAAVRSGLPQWGTVPVLAVDRAPPPGAVGEVVRAGAASGCVVLDLARGPGALRSAGVAECDLVVLVAGARVRQVAAAHAVLASLGDVPTGLVLRRGEVPVRDATELIAAPLLSVLPHAAVDLAARRPPRAICRVAAGLLDGLAAGGAARLRRVAA
jgi:hypothetical protein